MTEGSIALFVYDSSLDSDGLISMDLYQKSGSEVVALVDNENGTWEVSFDGGDTTATVYEDELTEVL